MISLQLIPGLWNTQFLAVKHQTVKWRTRFEINEGTRNIGTQKLLCGNVTKFSIAKNGCAHRVQHTRISLGVNFCTSSSLIFEDFWVWKLKSRVLCTARNVHSVSANPKNPFLSESSSQNLEFVVFSASANIEFHRKWRHQEFF